MACRKLVLKSPGVSGRFLILRNSRRYAATSLSVEEEAPSISQPTTGKARSRRAQLFEAEKARQLKNLGPISKIEVKLLGNEDDGVLVMNKGISTPYDCARHISEFVARNAAGALLFRRIEEVAEPGEKRRGKDAAGKGGAKKEGEEESPPEASYAFETEPYLLSDMQRPLSLPRPGPDATQLALRGEQVDVLGLKFAYFTDRNPGRLHNAYWRSCSFVLGAILESSFKEKHRVTLHSWPSSNYRTGSFVYDCKIEGLENWQPKQEELYSLSRTVMGKLRTAALPFEPLEVDVSVAERIFEDNPFKLEAARSVAGEALSGGSSSSTTRKGLVRLYRLGDHVDISRGPMIAHSAQIGNFAVVSFRPFETEEWGRLWRVQGVSLPATQRVNSWTWDVLVHAAKRKNPMRYPGTVVEEETRNG